jgi:hypothetical protein
MGESDTTCLQRVMLINLPGVELTYTALLKIRDTQLKLHGQEIYFAIMYALPYHPISAIELKCAVILGIAYDSFISVSSVQWHKKINTNRNHD